jgi:hypothetical protein
MAGFFQNFRPDGQRLEHLFDDLPAGPEVYNRLRKVYAATANNKKRPSAPYFIVSELQPAAIDVLLRYATAQLENWRQMAVAIEERELGRISRMGEQGGFVLTGQIEFGVGALGRRKMTTSRKESYVRGLVAQCAGRGRRGEARAALSERPGGRRSERARLGRLGVGPSDERGHR